MNSSFEQRLNTGNIGERLVKEWLGDVGYRIYSPENDGSHWCDIFAHDQLKQTLVACEVKNKDRMNLYNATGISLKTLREYQNLEETHNLNVLLFFVDAFLKKIYYAPLKELMEDYECDGKKYPNYKIARNIVLFPIDKMETIKILTDEEVMEIKESRLN